MRAPAGHILVYVNPPRPGPPARAAARHRAQAGSACGEGFALQREG